MFSDFAGIYNDDKSQADILSNSHYYNTKKNYLTVHKG